MESPTVEYNMESTTYHIHVAETRSVISGRNVSLMETYHERTIEDLYFDKLEDVSVQTD